MHNRRWVKYDIIPLKSIVRIDESSVTVVTLCKSENIFLVSVSRDDFSPDLSYTSNGIKSCDVGVGEELIWDIEVFASDAQITIALNSGKKFKITKNSNDEFVIEEVYSD